MEKNLNACDLPKLNQYKINKVTELYKNNKTDPQALMLPLGRQRQADLCEFKASLVYRANSETAKATQRNPVRGKKKVLGCAYNPTYKGG